MNEENIKYVISFDRTDLKLIGNALCAGTHESLVDYEELKSFLLKFSKEERDIISEGYGNDLEEYL